MDTGILWGAAATASVASVTGYWLQKKREDDAERAAENADDSGPDDTKARCKAAQKAKKDPGFAKAAALKSAIAAVTAKEQKEWKAERYAQVSQTDAYKDSEDKTNFMHNELAKIKDDEAAYREKKKEDDQAQQDALQNWLRTGENPPAGMEDVSEAERLAMYQKTPEYQNYQAGMEKWGKEQDAYQNWLRTGKNPPIGMEDVTEAERLAMYKQTDEYQNYQKGMAEWEVQKAMQEYRAGERDLLPNVPVFSKGMSETDLAQSLQQNQGPTNYCGSYSISTALNMLYGTKTTGLDVVNSFTHDFGVGNFFVRWPRLSWLPNGAAVLPYQQAQIVNEYSSIILGQDTNLPTAEVKNLRLDELPRLIADPNKAVLMTYNTVPGTITSGHVVVLAGYTPANSKTPAKFYFLNSGAQQNPDPNLLTPKTIDEMNALLADPIGLENEQFNPNFVVISKP